MAASPGPAASPEARPAGGLSDGGARALGRCAVCLSEMHLRAGAEEARLAEEDTPPLPADDVAYVKCGHAFHAACARRWARAVARATRATAVPCPLCKRPAKRMALVLRHESGGGEDDDASVWGGVRLHWETLVPNATARAGAVSAGDAAIRKRRRVYEGAVGQPANASDDDNAEDSHASVGVPVDELVRFVHRDFMALLNLYGATRDDADADADAAFAARYIARSAAAATTDAASSAPPAVVRAATPGARAAVRAAVATAVSNFMPPDGHAADALAAQVVAFLRSGAVSTAAYDALVRGAVPAARRARHAPVATDR